MEAMRRKLYGSSYRIFRAGLVPSALGSSTLQARPLANRSRKCKLATNRSATRSSDLISVPNTQDPKFPRGKSTTLNNSRNLSFRFRPCLERSATAWRFLLDVSNRGHTMVRLVSQRRTLVLVH